MYSKWLPTTRTVQKSGYVLRSSSRLIGHGLCGLWQNAGLRLVWDVRQRSGMYINICIVIWYTVSSRQSTPSWKHVYNTFNIPVRRGDGYWFRPERHIPKGTILSGRPKCPQAIQDSLARKHGLQSMQCFWMSQPFKGLRHISLQYQHEAKT